MEISGSQQEIMVDYMERHGDLSKISKSALRRTRIQRRWQELSGLLNADTLGPPRPASKWRKVWADMKLNTKKKSACIIQRQTGTGGRPATLLVLTPLEERVLAIIGLEASGVPVHEAGFPQIAASSLAPAASCSAPVAFSPAPAPSCSAASYSGPGAPSPAPAASSSTQSKPLIVIAIRFGEVTSPPPAAVRRIPATPQRRRRLIAGPSLRNDGNHRSHRESRPAGAHRSRSRRRVATTPREHHVDELLRAQEFNAAAERERTAVFSGIVAEWTSLRARELALYERQVAVMERVVNLAERYFK